MTNKANDTEFTPFTHEELELKNALLSEARELKDKERFSERLASAMIYASIVEYLGEHLLVNLRYLVYRTTYTEFAGIIFIDERKNPGKQTLGAITDLLRKYNFPDKEGIVKILQSITKTLKVL